MLNKESETNPCDVTTLMPGDMVYYYNFDKGEFIVDKGVVKSENFYTDGVDVHGMAGISTFLSGLFVK